MRELYIAGRRVADDDPPFIIAELGHNHGGSIDLCKRMMDIAAQCGADAVKLQKRDNRTLYPPAMYNAPYNSEHAFGPTYGEHREALEFGWDEYQELKRHAESLALIFFATAFDIASADFLGRLGVPAIKIASGDLCNYPLLDACAEMAPLIISTGGHDMAQVERTYYYLQERKARFALLQATAVYPCPPQLLNLMVIRRYRDLFASIAIGISDHNEGISMAPIAWMLGARIFEKHFTLSRAAKGSDNHFSLEPEQFRRMVNDLRGMPAALGEGEKYSYEEETPAMAKMRSIDWRQLSV